MIQHFLENLDTDCWTTMSERYEEFVCLSVCVTIANNKWGNRGAVGREVDSNEFWSNAVPGYSIPNLAAEGDSLSSKTLPKGMY